MLHESGPRDYDIVTLGEAMLRLSPPGMLRLGQTTTLEMQVGGAEWNVACNLAHLGLRATWLTRLTRNPLGELIAAQTRLHGVDTGQIAWTDQDRVGVYFIEYGRGPRPTSVTYDRADSAASKMGPADFDLSLLSRSRLFLTSGITAALGASCRDLCAEAIARARAGGAVAVFDVNHRSKLWSGPQAHAAISPLIRASSLLLCSRGDAGLVFGYTGTPAELTDALQQELGLPVIVTLGASGSCARDEQGRFLLVEHPPTAEVDRVGAGDAFASGVLYGLLSYGSLEAALPYGGALAALKLTVPGDVAWIGREELEALVAGGQAGGIRR
jgi:2-dehydro-3-deoxygluconokinase